MTSGKSSSPSPRATASKKGAIGSTLNVTGPPPMTSGSSLRLWAARLGMPAKSSNKTMLLAASSYRSDIPRMWNSRMGVLLSRVLRSAFLLLRMASKSFQGEKPALRQRLHLRSGGDRVCGCRCATCDFVGIREGEGDSTPHSGEVLMDRVDLVSQITRRLLDEGKDIPCVV